MRYKSLILLMFFIAAGTTGCNDAGSGIAALLNGKPIYVAELDKSNGGKIAQQIYEMRRQALDYIIEDKLLNQAAAAKGITVEELLKQEVENKVEEPTEAEVKAIYDTNKDRFGENFDEAKKQIADILKQNRSNIKEHGLIQQLRAEAKIETKLERPPLERVNVSADDDPAQGPENAKVTMIEFTDYQCPFCGRARGTVNQILSVYKNNVRYVLRDFPLSFHKDSFQAHLAAQCANDQGKYWEYNKELFDNQQRLKKEDLIKYAKEISLDMEPFNQCLDSKKYAEEVRKDMTDGSKAGVNGTPAFFINGMLISGAQPFTKFKELIDEELGR